MIDVSALQMLLVAVTAWLDRREREALAYLIEETAYCGVSWMGDAFA